MKRITAIPPIVFALTASALEAQEWRTDFSRHTVPLEEIVPGGPPKDGIPAIDEPRFVSVDRANRWLDDREPVMVVEHEGDARAYPYQILIWHEIVNDAVGGLPLAVTYCPLCNTALVFRRTHDGRVLDFGTTGRLRHSDLVMYDRQTRAGGSRRPVRRSSARSPGTGSTSTQSRRSAGVTSSALTPAAAFCRGRRATIVLTAAIPTPTTTAARGRSQGSSPNVWMTDCPPWSEWPR